ncbi:hypothetical protein [Methylovorus glucosotrophus]|uniref:hypothetical protein n=1 Tax=Methylovorus glucosotrophus TaxID=266009 RepID=UPI0011D0D637|nr:hypothetical protein [Methylovorus glucosotrophus]
MTHEEFEACKLPVKLSFKESEASRQVLVLGLSIESAAYCVGLDTVDGVNAIKSAIEMINTALKNSN